MSEQGSEDIDFIPELGDFITILSDTHTTTTGRIVYRDETLLRVRPVNSRIVVDFPIGEDGTFDPSIGVKSLIIKEKRKYPHYSKQLNAVLGDEIEVIDPTGKSLGIVGKVTEIIATDDMDAIRLDNAKYLNFRFIGPKKAIGILVPHSPIGNDANENTEEHIPNTILPPIPEFEFDPAIVSDDTGEEQFTFSDSIQRQDMFTSFIDDVSVKRQTDPKTIQAIYRLTDVFLALKNSIVVRDKTGAIRIDADQRSYIVNTVQEALSKQPPGHSLGGILPVANVKKALFMDIVEDEIVEKDCVGKNDLETLFQIMTSRQNFENSQSKEPGFLPYIYSMFKSVRAYEPVNQEESFIEMDQDVLRSKIPPEQVDGFPIVPPFEIKNEVQLLQNNAVGFIKNRYVRLLGPSLTKITQKSELSEANYSVAIADTADTIANIVLSPKLLFQRQPIRSSVLVWDIMTSERSRKNNKIFYDMLIKDWQSQHVILPTDSDVLITDLLEERIQPQLSFINQNYTSVLDSLGLRNLEPSENIYKVLIQSVTQGQSEWKEAFSKLQDSSKGAKQSEQTFANIASIRSALFTTKGNPSFHENLEAFAEKYKYSPLRVSDIVLANELFQAMSYSFYKLWYSLVGGATSRIVSLNEMDYSLEKERQRQKKQRLR